MGKFASKETTAGGPVAWADISGKPNTLSGYGITDAAPINNPVFTGTVTMPLFTMGSGVNAMKAIIYSESNYRYGFGIQSNEFRQFFPTGGHLSFGVISTADGSTWSEKVRITESGAIDLMASGMASPSGFGYGLFPQSSVGLGMYSYAGKIGFWTGSTPAQTMQLDGGTLKATGDIIAAATI